jgi:hypothetical protein
MRRFDPRTSRWLPTFQFTLRNLLTVTVGLCVSLSLMTWNLHVGGMLLIAFGGTWLTGASISARQQHLAYALAAFTSGVFCYLILSIPITWVGMSLVDIRSWPSLPAILCLCSAILVVSLVMRGAVGIDQFEPAVQTTLIFTYATALVFIVGLNVAGVEDVDYPELERSIGTAAAELFAAFAVLTLSLYVVAPLALAVMAALREVDRLTWSSQRKIQEVIDTVEVLQVEGICPIRVEDIARKAKLGAALTKSYLDELCKNGTLHWQEETGYYCAWRLPKQEG